MYLISNQSVFKSVFHEEFSGVCTKFEFGHFGHFRFRFLQFCTKILGKLEMVQINSGRGDFENMVFKKIYYRQVPGKSSASQKTTNRQHVIPVLTGKCQRIACGCFDLRRISLRGKSEIKKNQNKTKKWLFFRFEKENIFLIPKILLYISKYMIYYYHKYSKRVLLVYIFNFIVAEKVLKVKNFPFKSLIFLFFTLLLLLVLIY